MENLWQKAKALAEEAAKRSQTLTASPAKIADIVSETAKRSKDIAAEASKKAVELKTAALSLADHIPSLSTISDLPSESELQKFGVGDDLRDFVKGLTLSTFQNFPVQDDVVASDAVTISNVRQDLSEWQQKHANLVLTSVKEISKLRYELCPRHMTDRRFWRIYFTLVSTYVTPYEMKYLEEIELRQAEQAMGNIVDQTAVVTGDGTGSNLKRKASISSTEQDLDKFLLGDLEDSDGPADDGDDDHFDDDFDKIDNSEVEDEK